MQAHNGSTQAHLQTPLRLFGSRTCNQTYHREHRVGSHFSLRKRAFLGPGAHKPDGTQGVQMVKNPEGEPIIFLQSLRIFKLKKGPASQPRG